MEFSNELRAEVGRGEMRQALEFLEKDWPIEQGSRVYAEIGNDNQEYIYQADVRGRKIEIKRKGWKDILAATGIGRWQGGDGLEAKVIMVDGGRNAVGRMEGVVLMVDLSKDGESLTKDKPLVIEDETVMYFDGEPRPELEKIVKELEHCGRLNLKPGDARVESIKKRMVLLPNSAWNERRNRVVKSAFDRLIPLLTSVKFEEKTTTEVVVN